MKKQSLKFILLPFVMLLVAESFSLIQFLMQLSSGVIIDQLMNDFALSALGAGVLSSSIYIVYVGLQVPSAMLLDRFGARRILTIGGIISAVGALLFAMAQYVWVAEIGRLLVGMGTSCAFVSVLYIISRWFHPRRFALMTGLSETVGMTGGLLGTVFLASLLQTMPWRVTMIITAIVFAVLGLLSWLLIRDQRPGDEETAEVSAPIDLSAFLKEVKRVMLSPGLWINGLYASLIFGIVTVFIALWSIPFLMEEAHLTKPLATLISSTTLVGIAIGSPLLGWLEPRIKNLRLFLSVAALSCAILLTSIIYFPPSNLWLYDAYMFLLGLGISAYVLNFTIANRIAPSAVRTTAIGFTNMLSVITAPLFQPLIGFFLHLGAQSHHHILHGQEVYRLDDFHYALSVLPMMAFLAALLAWFIPMTPMQDSLDHDDKGGLAEYSRPDKAAQSV